MARRLQALFEVEAVLTAKVPLHVGNADNELGQDAPLAVNGKGEPYLPGTSLAGPMRSWWKEAFNDEAIWGQIEEAKERGASGYASLISVDDAPAQLIGGALELRDGVGIDRITGAAAARIKYDRQILPAGTTFSLKLRVELPLEAIDARSCTKADANLFENRLISMLVALEAGDIHFGAAKTRGLGRLEASGIKVYRHDHATKAGILARIGGKSPPLDWKQLKTKVAPVDLANKITLLIHWSASTSVYNKSGEEGLSIDALPLTTASGTANKDRVPVITGASVKGAMRSHAERICRTLGGNFGVAASDEKHLSQISVELVEALFGGPGTPEESSKKDEHDATPKSNRIGLGALGVEDCLIGQPISNSDWRKIVDAYSENADEAVRSAQTVVDTTQWNQARVSQHVAIDRWTGGAAEGFLYNRLELQPPRDQVFRLSLDLGRIVAGDGRDLSGAGTVLLLFVLRDLAQGKIPIGFGSTRGLGTIEVTGFTIDRSGSEAEKRGFMEGLYQTSALALHGSDFLKRFESANAGWIEYWQRQAQQRAAK